VKEESPNDYQIFAEDAPYFKISVYVSATVEGTTEDFNVNFELCTDKKKRDLPHSIFLEQQISRENNFI
jgi:hypothetical protein